ncbi:hypothetical protein ACGFYQ_34150 [Streptomyces sp. NPDC048258]|uniref:hypothetical protein n=1 Tax=Streptomyces sp. NPDC048258 TaxID=3365527 RepID=UPI00371CD241
MTTQRTPRALAREAAGLFITALGALGVLAALGTLHWAAGLIAAMSGLITTGLLVGSPPGPLWKRAAGFGTALIGYGGLTAAAFVLCPPFGWLGISLAVAGAGLLLSSVEGEGPA